MSVIVGLGICGARRNHQRRLLYRDLVNVTEEVSSAAYNVLKAALAYKPASMKQIARLQAITGNLEWYLPLTKRVVGQTRRRVFDGEAVPAAEKLVSIFEEHTDIIVKAPRKTQYGHKVTLTGGASSMILDCVIAKGNPADSSEAEAMIDRQIEIYPALLTNLLLQGPIHSNLRRFLDSLARRTDSTTSLANLARTPNLTPSWAFRDEHW